jgi:uncharacterized membrane protein
MLEAYCVPCSFAGSWKLTEALNCLSQLLSRNRRMYYFACILLNIHHTKNVLMKVLHHNGICTLFHVPIFSIISHCGMFMKFDLIFTYTWTIIPLQAFFPFK